MNERIEQLAGRKSFGDLNAEERALVLTEMSEEAYEQMHRVLSAAAELDSGARPPAHLRASLLKQVKPAPARFPVWQAAALLVLGFGTAWFLKPTAEHNIVKTEVSIQVDTIWLEKTLWKETIRYRTKTVYQTIAAASLVVPDSVAWTPVKTPLETAPINPHVGASLNDTPQLMEFFTKAK